MDGKLIIFSAPSGAGKTTIVKRMLQAFGNIEFSVSACSRPMRPGEVDGCDYYFLSPDEFSKRIGSNQFIEWEEVYPGSFYGTFRSELDRIWGKGKHVAFDVDVKGGMNLKKKFGSRALALFIMPPSIEKLRERLVARGTETEESLAKRIGKAQEEMGYATRFDTIVVNDILEQAVADAAAHIEKFLSHG